MAGFNSGDRREEKMSVRGARERDRTENGCLASLFSPRTTSSLAREARGGGRGEKGVECLAEKALNRKYLL